jgi:hypothetical protein
MSKTIQIPVALWGDNLPDSQFGGPEIQEAVKRHGLCSGGTRVKEDALRGQTGCGKTLDSGEIVGKHTSGAKAQVDYIAFTPGINPRPTLKPSFSAACKARRILNHLRHD